MAEIRDIKPANPPTDLGPRKKILTAGNPGPIIGTVMHDVADHLLFDTRSSDAVAPVVSLSNLLLVLVLITAIAGVQT
jgi:hypothetical protein